AGDGIRDFHVTGVQTCALPISDPAAALASGRAMDSWRAMVTAQGGDPHAPLPVAAEVETVRAERDGTVVRVDALGIGTAAWRLRSGERRVGQEGSWTRTTAQ